MTFIIFLLYKVFIKALLFGPHLNNHILLNWQGNDVTDVSICLLHFFFTETQMKS